MRSKISPPVRPISSSIDSRAVAGPITPHAAPARPSARDVLEARPRGAPPLDPAATPAPFEKIHKGDVHVSTAKDLARLEGVTAIEGSLVIDAGEITAT